MAQYQAENYFAIDPVLNRKISFRAFALDRRIICDAQELWDGARTTVYAGITQCLMLPNHAQGFLSVSRTVYRKGLLPVKK
jgi:LuxR family transcriptional regulator